MKEKVFACENASEQQDYREYSDANKHLIRGVQYP